ncbi:hypothetical protein NGRA_1660 [Nosema granulosis]|uniref:Uncharacterized protein n=1 Tax=Nosema granulosis TaxID=83296 RepID=A0A9P6KYY3_9MICR|nr:hypothetical protein NGRA_1660 [Nosema granulosis]
MKILFSLYLLSCTCGKIEYAMSQMGLYISYNSDISLVKSSFKIYEITLTVNENCGVVYNYLYFDGKNRIVYGCCDYNLVRKALLKENNEMYQSLVLKYMFKNSRRNMKDVDLPIFRKLNHIVDYGNNIEMYFCGSTSPFGSLSKEIDPFLCSRIHVEKNNILSFNVSNFKKPYKFLYFKDANDCLEGLKGCLNPKGNKKLSLLKHFSEKAGKKSIDELNISTSTTSLSPAFGILKDIYALLAVISKKCSNIVPNIFPEKRKSIYGRMLCSVCINFNTNIQEKSSKNVNFIKFKFFNGIGDDITSSSIQYYLISTCVFIPFDELLQRSISSVEIEFNNRTTGKINLDEYYEKAKKKIAFNIKEYN